MTHPDILAALAREVLIRPVRSGDAPLLAGRGPGTLEYEIPLMTPPGNPRYEQKPRRVSQPC